MSEMFHPPVGFYEFEADLERIIAEEANDILNTHCVFKGSYNENTGFSSSEILTERIDVQQDDGTYIALRLRMMNQVNVGANGALDPSIPQHDVAIGLLLEYVAFDDAALEQYSHMLDDAVQWQPYVFIGAESSDKQAQVCVLNAKNGAELSMQDKLESLRALRALRSYLAAERLDRDVHETLHPEYEHDGCEDISEVISQKYGTFNPGNYFTGYSCNICELPYSLCSHQTAWQN